MPSPPNPYTVEPLLCFIRVHPENCRLKFQEVDGCKYGGAWVISNIIMKTVHANPIRTIDSQHGFRGWKLKPDSQTPFWRMDFNAKN